MSNDIKNLIDDIINNTHNSYPAKGEYKNSEDYVTQPATFDKGEFRNKLSMGVLKDVVSAMMHDDTQNLDNMIDTSISNHINDNYNGSSYNYLINARDNLNSPLITDIVQEIDNKTENIANTIAKKKDITCVDKNTDVKDIVKNVDNYDEFREKIKKKVSDKVIEDVSKVVTTRNDAPVFDDLDEKLKKTDMEDITSESVILSLCGHIVSESAMQGNQMSIEEGINRASIEYCITEMDKLFKNRSKNNIYTRYKI